MIIISILIVWACLWGIYSLMRFAFRARKKRNPYIDYHKIKINNDNLYADYQDWLIKNGSGVPVPKEVAPEDLEAERQIKKLLP